MHLANELLRELDAQELSADKRAVLRCLLARQYEQAGDYKAASEALAELWQGVGVRPQLEGLQDETKALVILRVGALTGWIGSERQIEGSQELAKDLITESLRMFEALGKRTQIGQARIDLAVCYWRAGAYDEARVMLQEALVEFDVRDVEQRAIALTWKAEVERASHRLNEALRIYNQSAPLFDEISNHFLIAHFHHGLANTLNQLSSTERRKDYVDLALIEYAAASVHFEHAGHQRYQACVENNLGFLFSSLGKYEDAHEHLDRAQMLMTRLKDDAHLGQIDETRARVLLAEGRIVEAERAARSAVARLEKGDALSLLAEALTTQGLALSHLRHSVQARAAFERAISVAQECGDLESAGLAALTLVEQLGNELSIEDVQKILVQAQELTNSQNLTTVRRLAKAAFQALSIAPNWKGFSLRGFVLRLEAHMIKAALKESKGAVTKAARLLGFKNHQNLAAILNTRHKDLKAIRKRARKRRRHLMAHPTGKKRSV